MNAGPELDALVAKHVMGLNPTRFDDLEPPVWFHVGTPNEVGTDIKPYSATWDGMRMVVEAMRARKCRVKLETAFGTQGPWWVTFLGEDNESCASAIDLPLACALAALRAVGQEVPE